MNLEKWVNWTAHLQKKIPFDTSRVFLIVGTYVLGEVGFFPFGSTFRLGMGSVFYVLCVYSFPRLATLSNGCLTGITVVLFRVLVGCLAYGQPLTPLLVGNAPAVLYYVALTAGIILPRFKRQKANPVRTSLYFVTFDFMANVLELAFSANFHVDRYSLDILALGAGIKGLFFLAFIATMELFRQRILREKEKEKFQGQLLLGATLYAEGYFLKKIMHDIEEATESSFQLYQELGQGPPVNAHQPALLNLAERIHEIKKDTQRVFSSINALIEPNDYTRIDLNELLNIVIEGQQRYAQSHLKQIKWITSSGFQICSVDNFFPILVVVNNILANGIDAIEDQGQIAVIWNIDSETLHMHLGNTGKPISPDDRELIFLPGFTTKYSDLGNASTGIGLTHVQHVLQEAGGNVQIKQTRGMTLWTWFHVQIPIRKMR
ncbi:HAMP domain-containing sensor histidine kinase [Desulfosporosinus sp. Sb-LF]|uniref:sensor histidine kinase n=1 Tax=Desulfosporosinus sp. Sb-LF TaxID=2560027 RepID=UPI00107F7BC7|nr:HAMP domain-containing sensor histidine kinase [Desulfosporosinus sp. Sb-LF]TGE31024.1 HAMP domain-containing histidine kinase [Desulfosporosinus sp. Sb-LF]